MACRSTAFSDPAFAHDMTRWNVETSSPPPNPQRHGGQQPPRLNHSDLRVWS